MIVFTNNKQPKFLELINLCRINHFQINDNLVAIDFVPKYLFLQKDLRPLTAPHKSVAWYSESSEDVNEDCLSFDKNWPEIIEFITT